MHALFALFILLISYVAHADEYESLYRAAGWPQQRANFSAALQATQQRYRDSLPAPLYNLLLENSNRRFDTRTMEQRALQRLRQVLPRPQAALQFFNGPIGRAVVLCETQASAPQTLAKYRYGLPPMTASGARLRLIQRLTRTLPLREAGADISLALAGVAADSLSQMLPGLGDINSTRAGLEQQRQQMMSRLEREQINTLLFIYYELNDAQLAEFTAFSESAAGRAYYQAALQTLRAGLQITQ